MWGKSLLLILGILVLGIFFRIYRLTSLPMYGDELTMVYDSYSISKTGMDATGEKLPVTFRMGAGRPGGYIYGSVPFVAIFGPTEVGVRALSILSGVGVIISIYFLARKFFSEKTAIMASFLLAISPWDIYLSRGGFETHFALLLALFGVTAFFYQKYIFWAFLWGLTIFTYPTFKLTLPLMFLILLWFGGFKKLIRSKVFIVSLVILTVFAGFAINETRKGRSEERFLKINIFSDIDLKEKILQKVNTERTIVELPPMLRPVFYNRPIEYMLILSGRYIGNFSPAFLFVSGDGNPRHNPGEMGMLYLAEIITVFMGLVYLWKDKRKEFNFMILWILIVPLATMLISDPHGLRNAFMLPPLILISAYGLSKLSRQMYVLFVFLIFIQLIFIFQRVYFLAPTKFASFWSKEAKDASIMAIENKKRGIDTTLSTKIDNIEYAYPVYDRIDPNLVISQYGKFPKIYGNVKIVNLNEQN